MLASWWKRKQVNTSKSAYKNSIAPDFSKAMWSCIQERLRCQEMHAKRTVLLEILQIVGSIKVGELHRPVPFLHNFAIWSSCNKPHAIVLSCTTSVHAHHITLCIEGCSTSSSTVASRAIYFMIEIYDSTRIICSIVFLNTSNHLSTIQE